MNRLKANARRRSMQNRGDTEFAFYERISGLGYSDDSQSEGEGYSDSEEGWTHRHDHDQMTDEEVEVERSDEEIDRDEDSSDRGVDADDGAEMEMDNEEVAAKKKRLDKGKGPADPTRSRPQTATTIQRDYEAEAQAKAERRKERHLNLSSRRPVIVLRRDSGWTFSQEAFFPQYLREQYSLADPRPPSVKPSSGSGSPHCQSHWPDEDDDAHPAVTDIYVSLEDSRRILP